MEVTGKNMDQVMMPKTEVTKEKEQEKEDKQVKIPEENKGNAVAGVQPNAGGHSKDQSNEDQRTKEKVLEGHQANQLVSQPQLMKPDPHQGNGQKAEVKPGETGVSRALGVAHPENKVDES